MDEERRQRLNELLEAALQRRPDDRPAFLKEACKDDPGLRDEVEKRLASEAGIGRVEDTAPANAPFPEGSGKELEGARVGQYRLKRVISSGGMGTVYEAIQEQPRRVVAVKVMRESMVSRSAFRRFETEAEILARLQHPGIAQVIEAGRHGGDDPGGRSVPYFVMEYIEGARSITRFAREEELSIKERLALFMQVCEAVNHGHQKGIIHRDLKPDNLLVNAQGRVKVIDFGVARATDSDLALTTMQTEADQLLGTLQYMSPEQCDADPHDLDIRSDVYSLGVVLYELLCETLPYDVGKSSIFDAARLIHERAPARPSSTNRALQGDMETILLKALEKERARRYQSLPEFREDIRRYLDGEVILAKPAGPATRIWKRIKRYPVISAAVGLAAAALLIYLISMLWYLVRLAEEEASALEEEDAAVTIWEDARIQARMAEARLQEIIRLSDIKRLSQLEAEAEALWPAYPEKIPDMVGWVEEAEKLAQRLEVHRATLALWSAPGDRRLGRNGGGDPVDRQWTHETLAELVAGLETFAKSKAGTLHRVHDRLAFARTIYWESIEKHEEAWSRAVASIANKGECPLYEGLAIAPQVGLVPLGRDPDSGLHEFAHLQTGTIPKRDRDGKLLMTGSCGLVFVLIPGGTFHMGAVRPTADHPEGEPNVDPQAYPWEGPVHRSRVDPFFLSKYEMTQGQWERFTGENPSAYGPEYTIAGNKHTLLHPVESVSCIDLERILSRLKLRLPTGPEWEFAARGGTTTVWWTGDSKASLLGAVNLIDETYTTAFKMEGVFEHGFKDGYAAHAPVGVFRPNPFGLHDVSGNVWEWCYFREYTETPPGEPGFDYFRSPYRGARGGSWYLTAEFCRSAYRNRIDPHYKGHDYGVRPARSMEGRARE